MARALRSLSRSVVTKLVFLELEGHTQSTCTVDIFTYFYIACRNFTAFGRCALENSAKPAKDMPAHWLTPVLFPTGVQLYVWSTCVTLHCLESSIALCFSGRRAGLLEWTALHYNSAQMLPLEVWRQNSSESLKCSVSMTLLQQFSIVGPVIFVCHKFVFPFKGPVPTLPKKQCNCKQFIPYFSASHFELQACSRDEHMWCCTDMNHLCINLPRPNGL